MLRITVKNEISPALTKFGIAIPEVARLSLRDIRDIITHQSVTAYMREPRPDEITNPISRTGSKPVRLIDRFKKENNTNIIRRLTGRLTHSLIGSQGGLQPFFLEIAGNEQIEKYEDSQGQVKLIFGSSTPYALVNERKRPYLAPAVADIDNSGVPGRIFDQRLNELASRVGL